MSVCPQKRLVKTELKGRKPEIEGLAIYVNDQKKELVFGIRERQVVDPRTTAIYFFGAEIVEAGLALKPFFKFDATDPAVPGAVGSGVASFIHRTCAGMGRLPRDDNHRASRPVLR